MADKLLARKVKVFRDLKRAGVAKDKALADVKATVTETAKREKWRTSELAMTMADWTTAADKVWK